MLISLRFDGRIYADENASYAHNIIGYRARKADATLSEEEGGYLRSDAFHWLRLQEPAPGFTPGR